MSHEKCWWKAALLGGTIAAGITSACFGGYKGVEFLYKESKDAIQRHMPNYNLNRWHTQTSVDATPNAAAPNAATTYRYAA